MCPKSAKVLTIYTARGIIRAKVRDVKNAPFDRRNGGDNLNIIYGYCRISTKKQDIERQVRNIIAAYPTARIVKEIYTGTKLIRKGLERILKEVQRGDTIVFDSVSRMSRNAEEGVKLYMALYDKGVELVFLKEPHINTSTYKQSLTNSIAPVGDEIADIYIEATNKVFRLLAAKQIELAFAQAQKEVDDLHQRTSEGMETARRKGKQIGQRKGSKLKVKKKAPAMAFIAKNSKSFGGNLNDRECAAAARISKNTMRKYKRELQEQYEGEGIQTVFEFITE